MIRSAVLNTAFAAALALGASLTLTVDAAQARVKVNEKTTYYHISGRDGAQLTRSMARGGLWNIRQAHAIAATQTTYDFGKPEIVVKNGWCRLSEPVVVLNLKYIYPKWPGYKRASPEMKAKWDKFYKELVAHEQEHGKIARAGAAQLDKAMRSVKVRDTRQCADFGVAISSKLEPILKKTAERQVGFDKREYKETSRVTRAQKLLFMAK
jgi:predicted secreted Zn-dependent protease